MKYYLKPTTLLDCACSTAGNRLPGAFTPVTMTVEEAIDHGAWDTYAGTLEIHVTIHDSKWFYDQFSPAELTTVYLSTENRAYLDLRDEY